MSPLLRCEGRSTSPSPATAKESGDRTRGFSWSGAVTLWKAVCPRMGLGGGLKLYFTLHRSTGLLQSLAKGFLEPSPPWPCLPCSSATHARDPNSRISPSEQPRPLIPWLPAPQPLTPLPPLLPFGTNRSLTPVGLWVCQFSTDRQPPYTAHQPDPTGHCSGLRPPPPYLHPQLSGSFLTSWRPPSKIRPRAQPAPRPHPRS